MKNCIDMTIFTQLFETSLNSLDGKSESDIRIAGLAQVLVMGEIKWIQF